MLGEKLITLRKKYGYSQQEIITKGNIFPTRKIRLLMKSEKLNYCQWINYVTLLVVP